MSKVKVTGSISANKILVIMLAAVVTSQIYGRNLHLPQVQSSYIMLHSSAYKLLWVSFDQRFYLNKEGLE